MSAFGPRQIARLATMVLAAAVLAGMPGVAVAAPRTHTVVIDKMKFGAIPTNLRVGDVILWVNKDIFRHTATARDHSFNVDIAPSQTARTVLRRSGAVPFFCTFHPGMKGQLIVARK